MLVDSFHEVHTMEPIAVVRAWHEAVSARDIERLLALSDPNIEIVGPRGSGYGHDLLREWLERAGLALTIQRAFVRDGRVVVAQHGQWRSVETGESLGEAVLASSFRVADGQVTFFARYERLDDALQASRLTVADEVFEK
jgi:hypothetical protein